MDFKLQHFKTTASKWKVWRKSEFDSFYAKTLFGDIIGEDELSETEYETAICAQGAEKLQISTQTSEGLALVTAQNETSEVPNAQDDKSTLCSKTANDYDTSGTYTNCDSDSSDNESDGSSSSSSSSSNSSDSSNKDENSSHGNSNHSESDDEGHESDCEEKENDSDNIDEQSVQYEQHAEAHEQQPGVLQPELLKCGGLRELLPKMRAARAVVLRAYRENSPNLLTVTRFLSWL